MKRKHINIAHVGNGKTKETAIYFLNARHGHEEEEFEGLWLQAHKVKYPKITDKKSEFYGYDGYAEDPCIFTRLSAIIWV